MRSIRLNSSPTTADCRWVWTKVAQKKSVERKSRKPNMISRVCVNEHQVVFFSFYLFIYFFIAWIGWDERSCRKCHRSKARIYRGNPIVSTPFSNPTHISTENSAPGEKQEKQNKSKASEREKYVKIDHLDQTGHRNDGNKGTAQSLDQRHKRKEKGRCKLSKCRGWVWLRQH